MNRKTCKPIVTRKAMPASHCRIVETLELQKARTRQLELERQLEELGKANLELEISRNKYALLYDFAPVGFFTFDRNAGIRTVNMTGANLLRQERSLLINRIFTQFVAEKDRSAFTEFLRIVFASHHKMTCRLKLSQGNNNPFFVRIEAMAADTDDECHAALMDITERKLADEALRESEYNLAKAQSMSHVGSWRSDILNGGLRVSNELLRIMRLSREKATQETFSDLIHPEDLGTVLSLLKQGAEHAKSYEIEHRLLLSDGTTKWVYTIVEPSVNIARQVVSLYGTTQDITERKQVETRLRNKKNELQAIFDSVNDGVIVFDHSGMIQNFNHICPQLFQDKILTGGSCRDIFHPEIALSPCSCPVELAIGGERVETSLVSTQNGNIISYIDITANPINDAFGEKTRALVFIKDVTLKRLQELQLIQTDKMSSIGVLATGVAHEINNPLTSVAGYAEALLRRFNDEPALREDSRLDVFPKYLEVIVRESYQCKKIISNLLNFGRRSNEIIGRANINDILLEILELLQHQPNYEKNEVVTRLQNNIPVIPCDPSELRQICMNLLVNAFHAIEDSGMVEISTKHSNNDEAVYLQVCDTGCGMAQDVIDRIWDPFFTTKEPGKGTGLGLALTYNIVKRLGGKISVTSSVGKGSQFTVRLPVPN